MEIKHNPSYYKNKLKTLNNDFNVNLNQLSSAYVFVNTYPSISTYATTYSNDEGEMDKTRSEIFLLRDSLEQDIDATNKNMNISIKKIDKIEKDNSIILAKFNNLEDLSDGAKGLFDDTKELYNFQLLENWLITISCIIVGFMTYKIQKK